TRRGPAPATPGTDRSHPYREAEAAADDTSWNTSSPVSPASTADTNQNAGTRRRNRRYHRSRRTARLPTANAEVGEGETDSTAAKDRFPAPRRSDTSVQRAPEESPRTAAPGCGTRCEPAS